jgi:virginiamycin B lyase
VTEFPVAGTRSANGIVAGPDGALWFTEIERDAIGRITTAGSITEFPLPTPDSGPLAITAGSDGALWFADNNAAVNRIGRITTSGSITEYPLPTPVTVPGQGITSGPDGSVWFTGSSGTDPRIGRVRLAPAPLTRRDCLHDGWRHLVDASGHPFRNQGQCVAFVVARRGSGSPGT